MKFTIFKRVAALLLALVMCLTAFPGFGITAHAATDVTDEIFMIAFPREGDSAYDDDWGHSALTFKNGWHTARSRYTNIRAIGSYSSQICYCIEPGVSQNTGDEFNQKGENFWDNYPSDYNDVLSPDEIKLFIGRIFQYGYTGSISLNWRSQNSADADNLSHAIATQLLIWETVVGERDSDFNKVDPGSYDAVLGYLNEKHPLRDQVMSYYNSMVSSVKKHTKLPSFMSKSTGKVQTVELTWNGSEYTATLTDSNEVLSGYTFSSDDSNLKFSVSGNKLTIISPTAPTDKVSITAEKTKSQRKGVVVWTDGVYGPEGELQDVVTFAETVSDPVKGYLNVKVSVGSLKIIKESEQNTFDQLTMMVMPSELEESVTSVPLELPTASIEADSTEPELAERNLAPLFEQNRDCIGWLSIPGTMLDYPVMHTPDVPLKYLRRDFFGNRSQSGVPFLDWRCNLTDDNLIIYGHNMKAGTMFSGITAYTDAAYRETHPVIEVETEQGCVVYTIFAVVRLPKTDRWYTFLGAEDEDSFCRAVADIRSRALYDTGITPCHGQQMLTLSTCYGSHDDDRLVVIGVDLNS